MQYWHRRLQRSVTETRRFRRGLPHVSETATGRILSFAADPQVEVPSKCADLLRRPPRLRQLVFDERQWVLPQRGFVALRRRPGLQIPDHGREIPSLFQPEDRRPLLGERELERSISPLDEIPLRRPVGPHDLVVVTVDDSLDLWRDMKPVVAPDGDHAAGDENA